jgi:hypothetical protein
MFYILLSKNAFDSAAASFHPLSVFAWNVGIDVSLAPVEAWQEVVDIEVVLGSAQK